MPIDINDFREYKGGNPEKIRESQRRRFASESLVDDIIALDQQCRDLQSEVSMLRNQYKTQSAQIGKLKKAGENTDELQKAVQELKANIAKKEQEASEAEIKVKQLVSQVGNYVADDVVVSNDEDKDNKVVKTWGNCDPKGDNLFHHEILHMIGGYDSERGVKVAGARGFFLKGPGVLLNQALINYGLSFLISKEYTPLQPPFFMKRSVMAETAQLSQFDEELYKIPSDNKDDEDAYLIATSEQPISAYHRGEWLQPEQLPLKYVGYSTCFRKEAGSSGRNVWGIFRVHQFEKIEQFVITDPEKSWEMLENMLNFSEEFYQSLNIPYRVVSIVSGALNNAASKKYDLEAWFPGLQEWRELVSCSNCTDYQSRAMETRFGYKKMGDREKKYVHMLNSTLTATERTICCILENYQDHSRGGVVVPEKLRPFMGGIDFIPFVNEKPVNKQEIKQKKAKDRKEKATSD